MAHLIGIDIGTSATKAVLVAPDGQVVAEATAERTNEGDAELFAGLDPTGWTTIGADPGGSGSAAAKEACPEFFGIEMCFLLGPGGWAFLLLFSALGGAILKGLAVQLANPKPAIFFGAVFVGLVPPETPLPMLALLMAVIFLDETAWYILVARLFSLPRPRAVYARMKTGVDRTFGVLMAGLGLKIALP